MHCMFNIVLHCEVQYCTIPCTFCGTKLNYTVEYIQYYIIYFDFKPTDISHVTASNNFFANLMQNIILYGPTYGNLFTMHEK